MRKLLREIDDLLAQNCNFVLASIVQHSGSTPRSSGAHMLIRSDGSIAGTIGGGLLEAIVRKDGALVWQTKTTIQKKLEFSGKDASVSDMICGGQVEVLIEWVGPDNAMDCKALSNIRKAVDRLGSVFIFGAGHVSQALARLTHLTGFYTVVLDDRADYANSDRFPLADEILTPVPIQAAFSDLFIDKYSYIVIVTRGHLQDKVVLDSALKTPAAYIGMIGSKRKCSLIFEDLGKMGWGKDALARVNAPIGIPISAETPEEIAVSIVAEMIQRRAGLRS